MHELGPEPNFNESMYFNLYDPAQGVGGWFRCGNRANEGYAEMTVCLYLPGGRVAFMYKRPEISNNDAFDAGGIRFDVRNRETLEREALRQAVADARARADAAATGAGRTIDSVVRIEEVGVPDFPRPMMRMAAQDAAVSTPIAPSTIEIHARVTLTASLR